MAVTIDIQDNPINSIVGQPKTDTVIVRTDSSIFKNFSRVEYQIEQRDKKDSRIIIHSHRPLNGTVLEVSSKILKIILPMRQKFRVRAFGFTGNGPVITSDTKSWVNFKTGNKSYGLPAAIRQLHIDDDRTPTQKRNKTIVVTNTAKQVETISSTGRQVINTKPMYNDVASIVNTTRGVTIITR